MTDIHQQAIPSNRPQTVPPMGTLISLLGHSQVYNHYSCFQSCCCLSQLKRKTKTPPKKGIIAHTASGFRTIYSKILGVKITLLQVSQSVSFHTKILYLLVMSLLL